MRKQNKTPEYTYPLELLKKKAERNRKALSKKLRVAEIPKGSNQPFAYALSQRENKRVCKILVEEVVTQILPRMKLESKAGKRYAVVYSFGTSEFAPPHGSLPNTRHDYMVCSEAWLMGAARGVYLHCEKMRLRPTIERWQGGSEDLSHSGFLLVVHF